MSTTTISRPISIKHFLALANKFSLSIDRVEYRYNEYCEFSPIYFYDDGGEELYITGNEFGVTRLIYCKGECSAYEIDIDESETIEVSDLPDAYGILDCVEELPSFDRDPANGDGNTIQYLKNSAVAKTLLSLFHDNQHFNKANWVELLTNRTFVNKSEYRRELGLTEFHLSQPQVEELATYLSELPCHGWELVEGYEYQSNASGTGIVATGYYGWLRPADDALKQDSNLEIRIYVNQSDLTGEILSYCESADK